MAPFCAVILLVLCIIRIQAGRTDCSRESSRKVRGLTKEVFSALGVNPTSLPEKCALNPELDVFGQHELHKSHDSGSDWQCSYCNKRFISEKYIDRHLENMHSHLIPDNATVCLGDYMKMFGFRTVVSPSFTQRLPQQGLYARIIKKSFGSLEKCTEKDIQAVVGQCQAMSSSCFPDSTINTKFQNMVCNNLKCVNGILKGGLYKGDENDDILTMRMVRIGCVCIIILIIFLQVFMTDSIFNQVRNQLRGKKGSVDYLHKHQKHGRRVYGYGWFVDTIISAVDQGKTSFNKMMKPTDKRR